MRIKKLAAFLAAAVMCCTLLVDSNRVLSRGSESASLTVSSSCMPNSSYSTISVHQIPEGHSNVENCKVEGIDDTWNEPSNEAMAMYVSDISDIYGHSNESLTELTFQEIATIIISTTYSVDSSVITLSNPIPLYDANDINTYIGFNFSFPENNGYITIATHSKTSLIKEITLNEIIPENTEKIYYLSEGELYYLKNDKYYTTEGTHIDKESFYNFLNERKQYYYNLPIDFLVELETDTMAQLSNISYLDNQDTFLLGSDESYCGQSGYGYGGIDDCSKYLKDRYGGTITKKTSKTLTMPNFTQNRWDDKNNCTLAAITRILSYYRNNGYTKIDIKYDDIYAKVKKVAKQYGYTSSDGTGFTKINNIVEDVLEDYGYDECKCKGIYVWTFNNQIKEEIDNNRPVIMNIARGYYGNHTVTVCGYAIYKRSKKVLGVNISTTYNMVQVYDGWSNTKKYIDYKAFAYDYTTSGFGSFNTIKMKK